MRTQPFAQKDLPAAPGHSRREPGAANESDSYTSFVRLSAFQIFSFRCTSDADAGQSARFSTIIFLHELSLKTCRNGAAQAPSFHIIFRRLNVRFDEENCESVRSDLRFH
jgi:hypothetical protein